MRGAKTTTVDELWKAAPSSGRVFDAAQVRGLPPGARRYLEHAVAPGAALASAVRLRMHGEIKLKGWVRFSADEVISWERGMIWRACVPMRGLVVRGFDSFLDGQGTMRWKLFGLIPILNASGPDITRSAAGRVNIESIWLPSVLCADDVSWSAPNGSGIHARFTAHGETAEIDCTIDEAGALQAVNMPRWGNPEKAAFHYANFGGLVEKEGSFAGYTIPTQMRVGWYFGAKGFESDGEFFRVTIDEAVYR